MTNNAISFHGINPTGRASELIQAAVQTAHTGTAKLLFISGGHGNRYTLMGGL